MNIGVLWLIAVSSLVLGLPIGFLLHFSGLNTKDKKIKKRLVTLSYVFIGTPLALLAVSALATQS